MGRTMEYFKNTAGNKRGLFSNWCQMMINKRLRCLPWGRPRVSYYFNERNPFAIVLKNENGSLLVISLIILMLLTLIGIAITTTASLELQIAGNERLHKNSFYRADGGSEISYELLEQNLGCAGGFTNSTITGTGSSLSLEVVKLNFWQNSPAANQNFETNRDFYFPSNYAAGTPHTNFTVGGNVSFSTGSAIQMVSGYEGKGKGVGAGGAHILYDVYSQHIGTNNSQAAIKTQWRHVIGQEGDCNY